MAMFLPPIGFTLKQDGKDFLPFRLNWWTEDSLINYNYALVTPPHFIKDFNFREEYKIPKDLFLLGDSGGFQVLSEKSKGREVKFTKEDILRWQENNCNVGIILDNPPVKLVGAHSNTQPLTKEEFTACAKETYNNAVWFYDNRKNKDMKLYNVVQGGTKEKIEIWWNTVTNNGKFLLDGYAIAPKPPADIFNSALMLGFMIHKGIKENIHVLGVAGFTTCPIIIWCSRYIKNLTYDAASYAQGNINSVMYLPFKLSLHQISEKSTPHLDKIPCNCCFCSKIKNITEKSTQYALTMHNLKQFIDYNYALNNSIKDKEMFLKIANNKKVKIAIEFIEDVVLLGFEKAYVKYKKYFIQSFTVIKQGSLKDF